jgi:broad specificity phosphatase PhoE
VTGKRGSLVLCLVRSGETAWEAEGRVHGVTDLPMTDPGRAAVAADIAAFPPASLSTIHHAPDEACAETARMLAARTHGKTKAVKALIDPDMGLLEGLLAATFAERYPSRQRQFEEDVLTLEPPEGEPVAAARARILRGVLKIVRRARSEEIALVLGDYGVGFVRTWLSSRPASSLRELQQARPRIERYLVARPILDDLEAAIDQVPTA